jgi:hypothetical protein
MLELDESASMAIGMSGWLLMVKRLDDEVWLCYPFFAKLSCYLFEWKLVDQ